MLELVLGFKIPRAATRAREHALTTATAVVAAARPSREFRDSTCYFEQRSGSPRVGGGRCRAPAFRQIAGTNAAHRLLGTATPAKWWQKQTSQSPTRSRLAARCVAASGQRRLLREPSSARQRRFAVVSAVGRCTSVGNWRGDFPLVSAIDSIDLCADRC